MPAGKVNRNILESNYQNPGEVYDDKKTEGAFEVIAQQVDENWQDFDTKMKAPEIQNPDYSVTTRKIAPWAVTREKINPGAVGAQELDDALINYYGDIAVKAKLDEHDVQLADNTNKLKKIEIHLASYPRLGTETTDDARIDRALTDLTDGSTLTFETGVSYTINTVKQINKNNITLNYNNSVINWTGKASGNVYGEVGIFNFHGQLVGGDALTYLRSVSNGTHQPPTESPVLLSIEQHVDKINTPPFIKCSKVRTSNNAYFAKGDYIWLMGWTKANRMPYSTTLFEPELRRLARVIDSDATYLYVDYFTPWNMTFVDIASERSRAMKVVPLKNITIRNCKMVNQTTLATVNSPTSQEIAEATSGISTLLIDGLKMDTYDFSNPKFNCVFNQYVRNLSLNNVTTRDAVMWGGGAGYGIQNIGCSNGEIKNVYTSKCRHSVDFSWSDNFNVEKVRGHNSYASDIAIHGIGEHDLHFNECSGALSIGHGINQFPQITGIVQVANSEIKLIVDKDQYTEKIIVKDSKVNFYEIPYSVETIFDHCEITQVMMLSTALYGINKRGKVFDSVYKIINGSTLTMFNTDNNTTRRIGLYDVDKIVLEVETKFAFDPMIYTDMPRFDLFRAKEITIDKSKMNQLRLVFSQTSKNLILNYLQSYYSSVSQNSGAVLVFDGSTFTDSNIIVNFNDNIVEAKGTTAAYSWIANLDNTKFTNCYVVFNMKDNTMLGNTNHTIQFKSTLANGVVSDKNNIVRFPSTGHNFNVTNNTILTS